MTRRTCVRAGERGLVAARRRARRAVKLEGGQARAPQVAALTGAGILAMGHSWP